MANEDRQIKFRYFDGKKMNQAWCIRMTRDGCYFFDEKLNKYFPLLQYTGVKDKKGKDIYEGDILQYVGKPNSQKQWPPLPPVEFKGGRFQIIKDKKNNYFGPPSFTKTHKIIGNMYQNPELLNYKNNQ